MEEKKSTVSKQYGSLSGHSQSSTHLMQEDQLNIDEGEGEISTERNSNNSVQNQDAESTLESIADDLNKLHHYNNVCDIIFRVFSFFGYTCVIVAFGLLFSDTSFKCSDPLAAVGAAISIVANIGLFVNGQKLRYDNRRCIKKYVLPKVPVPVTERVLKRFSSIALQPEDSALSCLNGRCCCGPCRPQCCLCCCQKPCLRKSKCECASCSGWCQYLRSCFPFLLTLEFVESTCNIVSSGWVLCSNVQAMIDRIHHKHAQMIFNELSVESRALEGFDMALASFSLLLFVVLRFITWFKHDTTEERPVKQIKELV